MHSLKAMTSRIEGFDAVGNVILFVVSAARTVGRSFQVLDRISLGVQRKPGVTIQVNSKHDTNILGNR